MARKLRSTLAGLLMIGLLSVQTAVNSSFIDSLPLPEHLDWGFDPDPFIEGGETAAETVNLLNGNVLETRLDVRFPSPNRRGLVFEAFYNSRSNVLGTLGHGWSHTYSASLTPPGGSEPHLRIIDETGRAHYFSETTQDRFTGVYQERTFVTRDASGKYDWYRLDGSRLKFYAAGKLAFIEDLAGNRLNLAYSGGVLQTVTDVATGRMLTFHFTPEGFVQEIVGPVTTAVPDGLWVSFAYTGQNLTSVAYKDGSGFTYEFNDPEDPHNLTAKRNNTGHLISSWGYSGDRCTSSFSRDGKGADSIEYLSDTQVNVTDSYGKARSYAIGTFGERRRVTSVSAPNAPYRKDNLIRWSYDGQMYLTQVEHGGGRVDQFESFNDRGYPGRARLAYQSGNERVIEFTYHPQMIALLSRTEKSVLNPAGNTVTTWDYDDPASGDPNIANEDPTALPCRLIERGYTKTIAGQVVGYAFTTSFTHSVKGELLSINGPKTGDGDTTLFAYDPQNGDLLSVTQPLSGALTGVIGFSEYDGAGSPRLMTDMNGHQTGLTYDGRGRITSTAYTKEITGDGVKDTVQFTAAGEVKSTTDEDGVKRSYTYDATYGRLLRIIDGLSAAGDDFMQLGYDAQGNVTVKSYYDRPSGDLTRQSRWSYQHPTYPGLLWKAIEPAVDGAAAATTVYNYDASGMVSSARDANGGTTTYEYDLFNRPMHIRQPATGDHGPVDTWLEYDSQGHLTLANIVDGTEEKSNIYAYNDMGWLISEATPDAGTTRFGYNAAGNRAWKIDSSGVQVSYTYDMANRLRTVSSDASGKLPQYLVTYRYDQGTDGTGRLTRVEDLSGSTELAYDARGRIVQKTSTIDGVPYVLGRTFTVGGRVERIAYTPAGSPAGRDLIFTRGECKCRVTQIDVVPGVTLFSSPTYRPFREVSGLGFGNGGVVANQFNIRGQMTASNPGRPMERSHTYDQVGRLLSISAPNTPWYNRVFTYDALGRLKVAAGPFGTLGYTYSQAGNRMSETEQGELKRSYTYAPGANQLASLTESGQPPVLYTHDACGRMIAAGPREFYYNQAGELIRVEDSGETRGEYLYNGFGQRVKKTIGSVDTLYLYDFDDNLIAEADTTGAIAFEFFYRGRSRLARLDVVNNQFQFFHNNQLGTPELMTDTTNTVIWEALYKPFGEVIVNPGSTVTNNFRFQGQYFDAETGNHYNYHRYYDPKTGRYLTPDPIGLAGGINPYVYVQNDPVNRVDPWGLVDLNLLPPESLEYDQANAVTSPPDTFTVASHANRWNFSNRDIHRPLSPRQLADMIRHHPNYRPGMTVRLDACDSGVSPGNGQPSPAQQVSDALGSGVVWAPNNFMWYRDDGSPVVAPEGANGLVDLSRQYDYSYLPFTPRGGGR